MSEIVLWGAGKFVKNYIQLVGYLGDEISYIVDNSSQKQGTYIEGTIVKGPDDLFKTSERIIISCLAIDEIRNYLNENGLADREMSISEYLDGFIKDKLETSASININSREVFFDLFSGSEWGGAENWNYMVASEILKEFPESNISIISDDIVNVENDSDIKIKRFRENDNIEEIIRYVDSFESVIFVNSFFGKAFFALLALKVLAPQKIRIVTVVHNDYRDLYRLCELFKDYIDIYTCVSSRIADYLVENLKISAYKVKHVFQPIDTKDVAYEERRHNGRIIIGIASRLSKSQKRADYIPIIIDKLEKKRIDYELLIAGDGECFDEIESYVMKNDLTSKIKLLGRISHDKIWDFWKAVDVYLNFSEFEGTSLAMLEAMCCGCVPVVTNVSGTNDYIIDGTNGVIREIGDLDGLCDSIGYLSKNRIELINMGNSARAVILEKSDIRQFVVKFYDLLCRMN